MEKELVAGNIGSVGKYDLAFKGGALVIEGAADQFGVKLSLSVDAKALLELIKAKIPGQIDDAVINIIELALLS